MADCFRTSGSYIKPNRETLLDYLSYALIIISIVGITRVLIGSHELTQGCVYVLSTNTVKHERHEYQALKEESVTTRLYPNEDSDSVSGSNENTTKDSDDDDNEDDKLDSTFDFTKSPKLEKVLRQNFSEKASKNQAYNTNYTETTITTYSTSTVVYKSSKDPKTTITTEKINRTSAPSVENFYDHDHFCPKYHQAYFPFILLIEAILFLLSGIIWIKVKI